jgi:malonate-semialdehyde dehydrogenase (acetylating)/methylmalonate-semialdehyde dehydrogenase
MDTITSERSPTSVLEMRNYIGGEWVEPSSGEFLDVIDPASGEPIARVPMSTAEDVERVVRAARAAQPAWARRPVIERARLLFKLHELVDRHREEYARMLTRDTGKALADARLEMLRAIETIECAVAIPQTMQGRTLGQIARGVDAETFRQPVGVCAAITPFNFPAMLLMWFLPFAIGCGNTFILKPSEQTPLVTELTFQLLEELELPPGVANLVHGGSDAVNAILEADVDAISFVGSAATARHIYERAGANGKRVQAFGGAKNYMVVLPDAVIDRSAANMAASAFGGAGQRCMAGSVIVAVGGVWDRLREPLIGNASAMTVGDGMTEGVGLGPVVSQDACERVRAMVEQGLRDGASVALDGRYPDADMRGSYIGPTILENVTAEMDVSREEIFGPVLSVVEVETLDEAIALVNAGRYGNGTSIFTESGAAVRRYREEVQVGMVGVNIGVAAPVAFFPFGGWKDSFLGDVGACAHEAIAFYTRNKTVTSRWFADVERGRYFVE